MLLRPQTPHTHTHTHARALEVTVHSILLFSVLNIVVVTRVRLLQAFSLLQPHYFTKQYFETSFDDYIARFPLTGVVGMHAHLLFNV